MTTQVKVQFLQAQWDTCDRVPDGLSAPGAGEWKDLEHSMDSDALPDRGAQPGCGTGTASGTQSDGMSQKDENSENVTIEPKFGENVIIAKTQEAVGVAANYGVDAGLDSICQWSVVSCHSAMPHAQGTKPAGRGGRGG